MTTGKRQVAVLERGRFRVLALDMDGTLAGADGRVSQRAITALGRAVPTPLAVWRAAGLSAPLIACGGALTIQPPGLEALDVRPLPEHLVVEALDLGTRLELVVSLWTQTEIWVTRRGPIAEMLSALNDLDVLEIDRLANHVPRAPVLKVMLGGEPATVDRAEADILAGLAGATASRSMRESLEATAANASKEQALEAVLRRLGVAPEQVIAAGDADNDLGMLRMAGFAIVPGDAMAGPRAAADLVVGPHHADGVAEFIDAFLDDLVRLGT